MWNNVFSHNCLIYVTKKQDHNASHTIEVLLVCVGDTFSQTVRRKCEETIRGKLCLEQRQGCKGF